MFECFFQLPLRYESWFIQEGAKLMTGFQYNKNDTGKCVALWKESVVCNTRGEGLHLLETQVDKASKRLLIHLINLTFPNSTNII